MADYIRFRVATAKLGVSMAFFALLAGLAEKARATPLATKPPATAGVLAQIARKAGGTREQIAIQKLDSALGGLEHKLAKSFYTTQKVNQTFLKIKSANTEFLKIKSANTDFLKIDSANANFLKIDDANASFLKIDDANARFLKIDGVAANANELGGQTADAFFQGNGNVISRSVTPPAGQTQQLLSLPGGIIVVSVSNPAGASPQLIIHNASGVSLPAVQDIAGNAPTSVTLAPNQDHPVSLTGAVNQLHIQIFPSGAAFPDVVTLMISSESPQSGTIEVVGQAFTGGV
jgi:hypothetical protein